MESTRNATRPICRNCSLAKVNRPRGLCWSCYYTPGVKRRYPSTSPNGRRGVGVGNGNQPSKEPAVSTTAEPGTPEKLAVMRRRARRGESLFHPADPFLFTGPAGMPRPPARVAIRPAGGAGEDAAVVSRFAGPRDGDVLDYCFVRGGG
jgi:hypothetical protein